MREFERDYAFGADVRPTRFVPRTSGATFEGYRARRRPGRHAQLSSASSPPSTARPRSCHADRRGLPRRALADYPNVDGVVALTHGTGCGMADAARASSCCERTLGGYARHPNFAGVLLVGLGCEVNQIDAAARGPDRLERRHHFRTMTIQETGGTAQDRRARASRRSREMLPHANEAQRQTVAGRASSSRRPAMRRLRRLFRHHRQPGAGRRASISSCATAAPRSCPRRRRSTAPSTCSRAARVTREVGEKLVERIQLVGGLHRAQRRRDEQQPVARQQGGRPTTILEKSLGAAAKGGTTDAHRRLRIRRAGDRARASCSWTRPATTRSRRPARSPAARNLICFTTGRGSAFGCKPTPSIKLATNTADVPPHGRRHGHQLRR